MREKILLLNTTVLSLRHEKERRGKTTSGLRYNIQLSEESIVTEIITAIEVLYFGSNCIAVRIKFPKIIQTGLICICNNSDLC